MHFAAFVAYVASYFKGDLSNEALNGFIVSQYPIVERALHGGEGIRACGPDAHDITCSFVSLTLSNF